MIADRALAFDALEELATAFGGRIDARGNFRMQQFFAAVVAQDPDQRVVDIYKATVGAGEKQAFLDIVEQFPIAPLRLATVGNVLENMNRLQDLALIDVNGRRGDQVGAIENAVDKLVIACGTAAQGAGAR